MRLHSFVAGLIASLIGSATLAANCDGFTDVDSSSGFCAAVTYIKDHGITLGCSNGTTYCPNDFVTRLQMAAFLQRAGQADPTNTLGDRSTTIGGGLENTVTDSYGVVGGGLSNTAGPFANVAGGNMNTASGLFSIVSGGEQNVAIGKFGTVIGGSTNMAFGDYSTALGGSQNTAAGVASVVVGTGAQTTTLAIGSFVFGDNSSGLIGSNAPNEFIVGASGGIRMLSNKNGTTGCSLVAGGGTWACTSSKDVKRDFQDVDRQAVLERVLVLPVQTWRYQNEAPEIRHMGTFAGDFRAAFGLGSDDRSISMADADGVALAAIQGLNARLESSQALIAEQAHELSEIKAQLATLSAAR